METKYYMITKDGTDTNGNDQQKGWIYTSEVYTEDKVQLMNEFIPEQKFWMANELVTEIQKADYDFIRYCSDNDVRFSATDFVLDKIGKGKSRRYV